MFPIVRSQVRALLAFLMVISIGACSRYELPQPPEPLKEIRWSGEAPTDVKTMGDPPPLTGSFTITGEITQYSLNGPPLRLRVQMDLVSSDGKTAQITARKITPADLAHLLKFPNTDSVTLQGRWPIEAIALLHKPSELELWLNRPSGTQGCVDRLSEKTKVELTTASIGSDLLHQYKTQSATTETRRNEIAGFVHAKRDGAVEDLQLKIRRWAKLGGDGCNLVQEELLSISKGKLRE